MLSFKFLADTIYTQLPSINVPLSIVHQVTAIFFEKEEVQHRLCSLNDRHFIFFVIVIFAPKCEKPQLDYTQRKDRLNKILTAANFHKAGIHFQRTFQYPNQSILICHSKSPYCSVFWLQSSKLYIFLLKYKRHTSTKFYYSSWISLLYLSIFPNISRIEFEGHSINVSSFFAIDLFPFCLVFLPSITFINAFLLHNVYP